LLYSGAADANAGFIHLLRFKQNLDCERPPVTANKEFLLRKNSTGTCATLRLGRRNPSAPPTFPLHSTQLNSRTEQQTMDKDRIKGAAEQAKGKVKEEAGKLTGDKKLETEGKIDKAAGKVQNTIGGIKDSLRDR
jgi:uncharacterized protein YjbJ (UPF0337 family)